MSKKLGTGEIAGKLANFVGKAQFSDLPESVVHETKYVLLDSIGCAIRGLSSDLGRISVELARRLGGRPESTIIGTGDKVSCTNAAFANGQLSNALDFDAICAGHDCPTVIAASLAVAESIQASGKDLLLAVALAHEIDTRIALATGAREEGWGFRTTITEGPDKGKTLFADTTGHARSTFGAVVAAGKLLNLSQGQLANAIGIAGSVCLPDTLGKWVEVIPHRMAKYGPAGWAAQAGVTSALLAEMGFTGDTTIFEGRRSFWRYTGRLNWSAERVLENLGREWQQKITYKHYPAGI
jgi:2-methylcitrate dehydratase PrpD